MKAIGESEGLPKLFGFCDLEQMTWLLYEGAVGSLMDIPLPMEPDDSQLLKLASSMFLMFSKKNVVFGNADNVHRAQFAITPDWRIVLADFVIVKSVTIPQKFSCKYLCEDTVKVAKSAKVECPFKCSGSCEKRDWSALTACILSFVVLQPLSVPYPQVGKYIKFARDGTVDDFLRNVLS